MAAVHALVLFHIVFGFLHQSLGLISDYKLCGDPECESMISRVQAQRDHSAKDCRFLNFKKGDIITVYYKLTGKRNDLWAGSMEKLSGLFPKDAIKIDQLFIDEKKEIQVPTQEYDFICFDEKGLVIEHSTEFEDLEDLSQETQETDLNEVRDKPTETEEREPSQNSVQDVSDQNTPETTETGGSSWIGSAVNGWFGRNEQSNDEPQDESSEESFKSRKIVMDIEENLMEEKTNSGTFGWISGELTNAFGFGNKELKTDAQDNIENPTNDEDTSSQQSSSWMSMGRDVLGFSEENTDAATKPEAEKEDENTNMEDQSTLNPSQNMDVADNIQGDENTPDDIAENNDSSLDDRITENEKEEKQAGWYGNMYNRITNLYKEDNEGKASVSENPASATSTEDKTKESESSSQSIFSVSGLKSMLKLPFQEDTVVTKDEEKTEKEEDTRKEEIQHNNMDQEEEMLIDIDEQDSNQIDTDVLASDDVKQLDEESNMTEDSTDSQILEENSADNLNEEVKSENKADFFEEKVEQDAKDVQSDEEKTGKEEDPGKKDFDEEQEDKMLTDSDEQESNQIDIDILNVTQSLSDKTMTLQDSIASDSTEQLDVESNMMEESIDSQILEKKSVDNINEEVKCESNADFLEGKVEQDTRDVQSEEKTVKEEDPRKEYLDEEKNNNKDQEEKMLIDIHEQDSNTIDTDVFSETQSLSLKESTASDSTEQLDVESNMTEDSTDSQTLEIKSADHLYEEVKSENNADFIEENMDQDMRDVQSEEKSGKEEDPGVREDDCIHEACLDVNKNTQQMISTTEVENNQVSGDTSVLGNPQNEPVFEEKDLSGITDNVEDVHTDEQEIRKHEDWASSETKKTTFQNDGLISEEHIEALNGLRQFYQMAVFVEVTINEIASIVDKVVSSLPDDIRPGPDLYGLPWEAVVFTGFLGLLTLLLFSCRFIHSIKSRLYASKEKQMAQKVAELLDEKCKVLETFSEVKQKFDKLESTLQNNGMSAQAAEKDSLEVASQKLEQSNAQMKKEIERLQEELSQQNKARKQQEDQLAELEQILRNLEEEAKERKSQLEQDNTTLKIHEINTERLQKNLQAAKEEHAMLLESKAQLVQEAEDWGERLGELEEEMKMCERSHTGMLEDCANKDDRIKSLTECLLKMRDWDSEDESCVDGSTNTAGAENGDSSDFRQKQKVQKLIEAAKMSADLKSMEEDKNRVFAKLADEIKAKEDLQEGIKQLEEQKEVLESESANYASESQKLQQKLQIMTEMYQENELKLHRMLTVEEKERLQKEEKLNKAGKKISLAAEELNTYRQRAKDLEEELERTSQAYKNQIVSHEKKAHDNWLAARAADRDLADVKRENAHLRQRLTDSQFKFEILEKDVREGRPLFRGERSPYGPSPLSRPSSETRAFLSPPTLMDGPPRLSPQFMGPGRASRGMVEPPSGGPDFERSGPHSDSGSLSPSWDRERRGPPPPTGHPLPDPGLPFKRPPPGPYPMGPLPPRPPLPPEPYFADKSDSSFLRNSSSISENESREGPHSMPGDMRLPPDPDSRMGPPPGPRLMGMPPLMDPRDPHFPPRGPYGPPEFFPPRGPGGPPIGMRGPLPPGMFPRAPMPLPQHMGYLPPRPQSDSFPPGPPPRPSPPGSEQPPNQSPSPHDVI
ncbi:melanoma inhibitory activity protein 2 isoform X5 [Labeo rohita]|uniref:melanoma inhibitory activity protein 2 isoform X5 n=1 Tax=Labeo rohita TaxID=84645 RepID=UPI0021E31944|nr:melanoma inhibitory activity protein 2 isoform X5 [Labeo rohita]